MKGASKRHRLAALRFFCHGQEGTTTLEYALVLTLVAVAAILSYQSLGDVMGSHVESGRGSISDAADPGSGFTDGMSEESGNAPPESAMDRRGRGGERGNRGWGRPETPADARDRGRGRGL
jgi:Flp pilus assembly pilin Flp